MYMEVIPFLVGYLALVVKFLHVYGGYSAQLPNGVKDLEVSPCIWRLFSSSSNSTCRSRSFSMYMEVIPTGCLSSIISVEFLHVYGGYSTVIVRSVTPSPVSPCIWRLFHCKITLSDALTSFSMYMEVIPSSI